MNRQGRCHLFWKGRRRADGLRWRVHKITEVAFYVPYMDKEPYEIHAAEDVNLSLMWLK